MNSRERARKTLNHQEADRPAIDLGATRMTGTLGWTYRALKQALGIDLGTVRIYDLFQMLTEAVLGTGCLRRKSESGENSRVYAG